MSWDEHRASKSTAFNMKGSGMTYKSIYTNFDQMQTLCGAL